MIFFSLFFLSFSFRLMLGFDWDRSDRRDDMDLREGGYTGIPASDNGKWNSGSSHCDKLNIISRRRKPELG